MADWFFKFKKAEDLVKEILRTVPETRDDDFKLLAVIWGYQGFKMTPEQFLAFKRCFPAETITRARRKLQEQGIYMPNTKKYEQRQLLSEEVRKKIND